MNPFIMDRDLLDLETLMMLRGIKGKAIEAQATGNPLAFVTDIAKPLRSMLIPFTPQQEGTGDPSPQNIRNILPWNGLTVFGGGKNLFDKDDPDIQLNKRVTTGGTIINSLYSQAVTGFISVKEGAKYIINNYIDENFFSCFYSERDIAKPVGAIFGNNEFPKTAPKGAKYLIVTIGNSGIDGFQIEVGQTDTAYEPYKPITNTDIVFQSAVYGGTLDAVSGVLTVEYAEVILKGTEEWYESENKFFVTSVSALKNNTAKQNIFCDLFKYSLNSADYLLQGQFTDSINSAYNIRIRKHDDAMTLQEFKSLLASNNMHIVYKAETPQEIQLTSAQINALVGNNTIWSDANGQMTATYLKKG